MHSAAIRTKEHAGSLGGGPEAWTSGSPMWHTIPFMASKPRVNPEHRAPLGRLPRGWKQRAMWRDPAYIKVMANPEMVDAVADLFEDEAWARDIDPKQLQIQPGRHVGPQFEQHYDDLLLRVGYKRPARGRKRRPDTYILMEFQSTVDPFMAVRLASQICLVYRELTSGLRSLGSKPLPAVVPIVIYTGKRKWTSRRDIAEAIESNVTRCRPTWPYELLDAWREGTRPAEGNLFLLLCHLERGTTPQALLEATKALRRRVTELGSKRLEETCALWLRGLFGERVPGENWEEYETMAKIEGALQGVAKIWTDQWQANARKEGRREGRRTGRREGRREGRIAGQREGRIEGQREGRREGQREGRQEERARMNASLRANLQERVRDRFGQAVAVAFAAAITTVESHEKLVDLAVHIAASESGDELLESVQRV